MTTEVGSFVTTLPSTEPTLVHWIDDCPTSKLEWWFPLVLAAAIYFTNIVYLLVKYLFKRYRPVPASLATAYPSIFRGIDQNDCDEDGDQDLDLIEEESVHRSRNQWLDEIPDGEMGDSKFPSMAFELPLEHAVKTEHSENDEDDGGKPVEHFVSPGLESIHTLNAESSTDYSKGRPGRSKSKTNSCYGSVHGSLNQRIRIRCEQMTSVSYRSGRIMLIIYVMLCTISWIIYIIGTIDLYMIETLPDVQQALEGRPPLIVQGLCLTPGLAALNLADLIIHTFFLVYFILRLGAAVDRCMFFFKFTSLVDVITICGAFVAVFQPRYHLDLGFLRALNIFNFGEVLNYLSILSSNHVIETVDIFFTMFAMWMLASGLIHLIIHLGDFWKEDHKALQWSYLDCCYFLLVTMSTVGFGDFYPVTILGRLSICVFIPVAIGIFAVFVPEIFRKVSARREQSDSYQALAGHQHVVVCGHFNNISLSAVLRGFFHIEHSSRRSLVNMVILRVSPIDLAMRAILTKYNAWVKYFQGTPADPQDLARICFRSSAGALVLATPNSSHSGDEDGANIMQAIALKAHSERIRVLVQLHHFKNKCLLNNFPRWTCRSKDMVICMDELRLGLMALNSLAPGFSTMILNLLNGYRVKSIGRQTQKEKWRREYEYGVSMEIYDVSLSYEFHNLCAQELTLFAYEKWNIVICAFYCVEPEQPSIIINPAGYRDLTVDSLTMKGIVIATNSIVVNRMRNYCTKCRAHETGEICQCPVRLQFFIQAAGKIERERTISDGSALPITEDKDEETNSETSLSDHQGVPQGFESDYPNQTESELVASHAEGGMLKPLTTKAENAPRFTINTIPVSISRSGQLARGGLRHSVFPNLAENSSMLNRSYVPKYVDSTGCFHWVPDTSIEKVKLTLSHAIKYQFRDHYLLCIVGPLASGSLNLKSFVYPLRFHWMEVKDIVILGDTSVIDEEEWVKIKNIPHVFLVQGNPCSINDLNAVRLKQCAACTILGESANATEADHCMRDKDTLLCAMTIRSMIEQSHRSIHMTTELHDEQNAHHFSSAESHHLDFKLPTRFQEAFARGVIFSNTLLYSSISSLYFSGAVFRFLRVLLFGIAVEELESTDLLRHGLQKRNPHTTPKASGNRVTLLKMSEVPFGTLLTRSIKRGLRYKDVFTHALMCWRILCLGIYRTDRRGFGFVITNPPTSLKICFDDQIFCFVPNECTTLTDDTSSVYPSPTVDSNSFFLNTPGATYGGMSAAELARQSAIVLRNLQQL